MKLKTLFKKNVNGSINQWSIFVDDYGYWTEFGQIGGTLTKSDKIIVEAKNIGKKNETTVEEQAIKEANSIWKKKMKSENFVENIDDVNNVLFNPPMLAKEYDGNYDTTIRYCQPKLDGIRCNISFDGDNVVAISRKNNPFYTVEHIKRELTQILENNPSIHIDGELYNHILHDDFNKVVSLVKKEHLDEIDLLEVEKYVRYNIYDLWDDNNPNMLFSQRLDKINELFGGLNYINIVDTYEITSNEDVEKYFTIFTESGYEGAILRKDSIYEHKRSKNLLKYKKFNEEEFKIIDICEGRVGGFAEYAWVELPNGLTCKATLSYSLDECTLFLNNKNDYIGKFATIKFFGYTKDGKLRFPVLKAIRNYE